MKMFKEGLAYEKEFPINWCPSCKTGLWPMRSCQRQLHEALRHRRDQERIETVDA